MTPMILRYILRHKTTFWLYIFDFYGIFIVSCVQKVPLFSEKWQPFLNFMITLLTKFNLPGTVSPAVLHFLIPCLLDIFVAEIIIGLKLLTRHQSVTLEFNGNMKPLKFKSSYNKRLSVVCSSVKYPTLFPGVTEKIKPIKIPTRKFAIDENYFISSQIKELLKDKVIEESYSPWRAQVVVVKKSPKWRLCIDYSQTINRFTEEDAFRVPRIDDMINGLAQSSTFRNMIWRAPIIKYP